MKPFHILEPADLVLTLESDPEFGAFERADSVTHGHVPVHTVLLAVKSEATQEDLDEAKAFSRRYVVSALHEEWEARLEKIDGQVCIMRRGGDDSEADFEGALIKNYEQMGEAGKAERRKIIEDYVNEKLDMVTIEAIEKYNEMYPYQYGESLATNYGGQDQTFGRNFSYASVFTEADNAEKNFSASLKRMPEWMQLLVHDHGLLVFKQYASDLNEEGLSIGASMGDVLFPSQPAIYLDQTLIDAGRHDGRDQRFTGLKSGLREHYKLDSILDGVLREELIHEFHKRADTTSRPHITGSEEEYEKIANQLLSTRAGEAASKVMEKIMADGKDSALLQLIEKLDPGGGSLMRPKKELSPLTNQLPNLSPDLSSFLKQWRQGISNSNHHRMQTAELLVDLYDAEIYLRTEEGKDKQQTSQELARVFGQEFYDISREYLNKWMDEAQQKLAIDVGDAEAARYRQKWEDDPFNHKNTLNLLSKYKMGDITRA